MIGLMALAAAGMVGCKPIDGAERLWAKPETRWVMIGEMHGTAEMPAFFADLVCRAAASGRPITVALEQDVEMQPAIDAFLASDGGSAARAAFLQAPMWHGEMQDGRSSRAMLDLYDRLRVMKQAAQIRALLAFIPTSHSYEGQGRYNLAMADTLRQMPVAPDGLIIAYMGSVHAAKSAFGQGEHAFLPAAADLPPARTVSVYVNDNGGQAWNCMADGCGPHAMQTREAQRGFTSAEALPWRYDWMFETGVKSTASLPAATAK